MSAAMNGAWPDRLFDAFKRADIRQVGYVPDAGHARLIERCQADPDIRAVPLVSPEIEHSVGLIAVDRDPVSPLVLAVFESAQKVSAPKRARGK